MTFDLNKTLGLIKGGLLDRENTWQSHLGENPGWQQTAIQLTGPLLVANVLVNVMASRLFGGYSAYGYHSNFLVSLLLGLVLAALGFVLAVLVFNVLAGVFKGTPNFSRAFAAFSLAAIPAWVAGMIGAFIPWLGGLVMLAGGITSLVFLYQIMPLALKVPDDKRVVHYVVSLIGVFVLNMIISLMIMPSSMRSGFNDDFSASRTPGSGVIGEMERQGQLMEAAGKDVYEPPSDGELSKGQVRAYADVMRKTRALHEEYAAELEKLSAEIKAKEDAGESVSMADMVKVYQGVGTGVSANNAEMEIVKTGGGNWAEHQWVKAQLRAAKVQRGEGSATLAHNFALYQEYQDDIEGEDD